MDQVKQDRKLTKEEREELESIAAKYKAGIVTEEEMRRAFELEGYDEQWAAYLARIKGFPKE